eukprot:gene3995-26885_t
MPSSPSPVDVILAFLSVLVTAAPGDNFPVVAGGAEGSRAGYHAVNGSSNDTCSITVKLGISRAPPPASASASTPRYRAVPLFPLYTGVWRAVNVLRCCEAARGAPSNKLTKKKVAKKTWNLFVRDLAAKTVTVQMAANNTVFDLKQAIYAKTNVPAKLQNLLFSTAKFAAAPDDALLADCNIGCGSTLIMTLAGGIRGKKQKKEQAVSTKVAKAIAAIQAQMVELQRVVDEHGAVASPELEAVAARQAADAVGSTLTVIKSLEHQLREAGEVAEMNELEGRVLNPLKHDLKVAQATLEAAMDVCTKTWKLTIEEPFQAAVDDEATFAALPMSAEHPDGSSMISIIGTIALKGGVTFESVTFKYEGSWARTTMDVAVSAVPEWMFASFAKKRVGDSTTLVQMILKDVDLYEKELARQITLPGGAAAVAALAEASSSDSILDQAVVGNSGSTGIVTKAWIMVTAAAAIATAAATDVALDSLAYVAHARLSAAPVSILLYEVVSGLLFSHNIDSSECLPGMVKGVLLALDLTNNTLDESQQASLQSALASDECRIRSLVLNNCDLGAAFGDALAEMFASGHLKLTVLGLSYNFDITEAAWIKIADAVATSKTLTNLDLSMNGNTITEAAWIKIAAAVATSKTLTNLNLRESNDITKAAWIKIAAAVATSKTLTNLNLEGNTQAAWIKIAAAVATSKTLTNLKHPFGPLGLSTNEPIKVAGMLRHDKA